MKNVVKKILIVLLVLILLVVIAAVLGYQFYVKPKIIEPIKEITQSEGVDISAFSQEAILDELEATLQEEDVRSFLDENAPGQTNELIDIIHNAKSKSADSENVEEAATQKPVETPESISENWEKPINPYSPLPTPTPEPTPVPTPTPKPEPTSKYDYLKSKVDPDDFSAALSLAGKVDPGYILGLLSGGLTASEKSELKKYLMSRLSASEISNGIRLFSEYSYLLG